MKIGFIGQGTVGKALADFYEHKDKLLEVVRYSLEAEYIGNKEKIKECDVVFIAVPTPTLWGIFSDTAVREALTLVGQGKIAVIKSTMLPGRSVALQKLNPDIEVLFSPEFLRADYAAEDTAHPFVNIVGTTKEGQEPSAALVNLLLPIAPEMRVMGATEAEMVKYCHNGAAVANIVFFNAMYDWAQELKINWQDIEAAVKTDPYIASRYSTVVDKQGRGAGGACFIKDFAALTRHCKGNPDAIKLLLDIEKYNLRLLSESKKDENIIVKVYK